MKAYRNTLFFVFIALIVILFYHNREYIYPDESKKTNADIYEKMNQDEISAVSSDGEAARMVCPSGEPVGIYVKTKGVMVVSVNEIDSPEGKQPSPCEGLLNPGDYIMRINGQQVRDKAAMIKKIQESNGHEISMYVHRESNDFQFRVTPVMSKSGTYVIGVWVKDDIAGIGTITYTDGNRFAALGHSINDNDTGLTFCVSDGAIYKTTIVRIRKPQPHMPGRLEGVINYADQFVIGRVEENNTFGIRGYLTKKQQSLSAEEKVPIAKKEDVHTGKAYLRSSLSGESQDYEIRIVTVDADNENGKCMEIAVVDERLLSLTGGIVQGISGTPILQDGKLIGAVTHVFVDDSTRGYGIFIEEMMK